MTVGERIKETREKQNITQTQLANACKVSKQTLYKYENNIITNIPSNKVESIAKYLSVSPSYLMGWEDSPVKDELKDIRYAAYQELEGESEELIRDVMDFIRYKKSKKE
ncbi:MAG: helix-turn-helix domain-containing protein [Ruminococcus sp.]